MSIFHTDVAFEITVGHRQRTFSQNQIEIMERSLRSLKKQNAKLRDKIRELENKLATQ